MYLQLLNTQIEYAMKKHQKTQVEKDFGMRTFSYSDKDDKLKCGFDYNSANEIISIEKTVIRIIETNHIIFSMKENIYGKIVGLECKSPNIFRLIKDYIDYDKAYYENRRLLKSALAMDIAKRFPIHHFNPYVDLFIKTMNELLVGKIDLESPTIFPGYSVIEHDKKMMKQVGILNEFIDKIRSEVASKAFQTTLKNYKRQVRQNHKSLTDYIDKLFKQYARLLVIRVDVSYAKDDGSMTEFQMKKRLEEVAADRKHFFANMRSNKLFEDKVGFVCKLEYGLEKGFHYHMFFFYDGSKVREDISLARMIGEYWKNDITKGRGLYFNCNAKKDEYKYPGIGMINHYEIELLANLKMAASYLTKTDYYAKVATKKGNMRTFFKGAVKAKTGNQGRPRVRVSPEQSVPPPMI